MSDVRDRQLDIAGLRRQQPRRCRCVIRPSVAHLIERQADVVRGSCCCATVRSCGRAPIISVASASINACNTISTERRMTSTSPPARTASSSSDRSNSSWASGVVSFVNPARSTTTITPMAHLTVDRHLTYTTRRDGSRVSSEPRSPRCGSECQVKVRSDSRATVRFRRSKGLVDSMSCAMIARSCTSRVSGACPVGAGLTCRPLRRVRAALVQSGGRVNRRTTTWLVVSVALLSACGADGAHPTTANTAGGSRPPVESSAATTSSSSTSTTGAHTPTTPTTSAAPTVPPTTGAVVSASGDESVPAPGGAPTVASTPLVFALGFDGESVFSVPADSEAATMSMLTVAGDTIVGLAGRCDPPGAVQVVAFDRHTGQRRWTTPLDGSAETWGWRVTTSDNVAVFETSDETGGAALRHRRPRRHATLAA